MTADAALHTFFNSFGLTALPDTAVKDGQQLPYATYSNGSGCTFGDTQDITFRLWYYTESEATPNAKVRQIRERFKNGGVTLRCDSGVIWLTPGNPFCVNATDETDTNVKLRYINLLRQDFII